MDKLDLWPRLVRIETHEELARVHGAASADGHGVLRATHAVVKGDEVVGAFGIAIPMVTMWLDTERVRPRESFHLINSVENVVLGSGSVCRHALVSKDSPFAAAMERMGYRPRGEVVVWEKVI